MLEVNSVYRVMQKDGFIERDSLAVAIGDALKESGRYQDGFATHIVQRMVAYIDGELISELSGGWRRIGVPMSGIDSCKVLDEDPEYAYESVMAKLKDFARMKELGLTPDSVKEFKVTLRRISLQLGGVNVSYPDSAKVLSSVESSESLSNVLVSEFGFVDGALSYFAKEIDDLANNYYT
ncbi:hypothetical protein [Vibrio owensii]|uniref:hypothetical protein n=1 Tax=Vibrio owensii TaxID=696485 RepID=UPI0018F119CB|nr:hypothetical protein [Vibrio owensii]